MNKDRIKKAFFLFTTYFAIVLTVHATTSSKNKQYPYNVTPIYSVAPYTTYSNGDVYIADKETIKNIIVKSDDVYIVDERDTEDPNICICNSYRIRSLKQINEILDIILEYEEKNPSPWDRSKESLYNEWILHNIGYELDIKRQRTMNVDLNNKDEDKFSCLILKK
jgi:hypothetical protein